MNQQVAVIRQHPFALIVSFQTNRQFARLFFQPQSHLVGDGLNLPLVRARTDDEGIGERGNSPKIENFDVDGFLRLCRAHGKKPGGGGDFNFSSGGLGCLQNTLLSLWYNERLLAGSSRWERNVDGEIT